MKTLTIACKYFFLVSFLFLLSCSEGGKDGTDLGTINIQTTTKNKEAEEHFLRGLAALHSFWYPEAEKEFTAAQKLDTTYQMAIWGEAMAQNMTFWQRQDLEKGRELVKKLAQLDDSELTELEKSFIESLNYLYDPEDEDKLSRDKKFKNYLERVHNKFPNEQEATALYALSILGVRRNGHDNSKLLMESAAIAQELFMENRNHPGAAHYLIHSVDDPTHARLGLEAAEIYSKIAPSSSHAKHMPSHIFFQIGMWNESVNSNIDAYQAGVDWVNGNDDLTKADRDNHSMEWLVYSMTQLGKYDDSEGRIDSLVVDAKLTDDSSVKMYRDMTLYRYTLESRRYQQLSIPEKEEKVGYLSYVEAFLLNVLAINDLVLGDKSRINDVLTRMDEIIKMNDDANQVFRVKVLKIMKKQVRSLLAWSNNKEEVALKLAAEVSAEEKALQTPNGPNYLPKPSFDLYGELLMYSGRYEDAIDQFIISLERMPNRSLPLMHLGNSYKGLNDHVNAVKYFDMLMKNWKDADLSIEELTPIKSYLEANKDLLNSVTSNTKVVVSSLGFDPNSITICKNPYKKI